MARLADYFIVVGYDQDKAGKFHNWTCDHAIQMSLNAEVYPGRQSVSGMLMPDNISLR